MAAVDIGQTIIDSLRDQFVRSQTLCKASASGVLIYPLPYDTTRVQVERSIPNPPWGTL